jgi:hypothetical protein
VVRELSKGSESSMGQLNSTTISEKSGESYANKTAREQVVHQSEPAWDSPKGGHSHIYLSGVDFI